MNTPSFLQYRIISFLRNHYDNVLMVIGFALTFFMLTNSVRFFLQLSAFSESAYSYEQSYSLLDDTLTEQTINQILEIFDGSGINCRIDGRYLTLGDRFIRESVSVYLSLTPDASEAFGNVKAWEAMPNSLILGNTVKEITYGSDEGLNLLLGGKEFSVFAFRRKVDIEDNSIFICWKNLDPAYREAILEGINEKYMPTEMFYIVLQSNSPMGTEPGNLTAAMGDRLMQVNVDQNINYLVSFQKELMGRDNGAMMLFSAVCCVLITNLWISRRKREYLIRRVFGYEKKDIGLLILKESGKIALLSLLLAWGIEAVYLLCRNGYTLGVQREFVGILISFLGAIVIQCLVLIWPIHQVLRINPTQSAIDSIQ